MKSIDNILSVLGLTAIPNPIALSLAAELDPLEENLSLVAQPDPMALGLVGGYNEILRSHRNDLFCLTDGDNK
jgi:hypothetical protein